MKVFFNKVVSSRYTINTIWLSLEKIIRLLFALTVGVWFARYLGPEQFGIYSYALSIATIVISVTTVGFDGIVVKKILEERFDNSIILGTSFVLRIVFSLFVVFCAFIYFDVAGSFESLLVLLIVVTSIFNSFDVIDYYFQSQVQSSYVVKSRLLGLFSVSVIKVFFILQQVGLLYFSLLFAVESFIAVCFMVLFYRAKGQRISRWKADATTAKELLKSGAPLLFNLLLVSLFWNIDKVMLKHMLGDLSQVGLYSVAVRLSEIWHFVPMVIVGSFFPAIVNAKLQDKLYLQKLRLLCNAFVLIAFFISISLCILSDYIVVFLYGVEYKESAALLSFLIWSNVFVFLGVVSGRYFIVERMEIYLVKRTLLGLMANVSLNYFLIPSYGVFGAVVATIISQIVVVFLADLLDYNKTKEIFWIKFGSLYGFLNINGYRL